MKVTIEKPENEKQEIQYPCLKIYSECYGGPYVVLFTEPRTGTVVSEGGHWPLGHYTNHWQESKFSPLPKGTKVIIEQ